MNDSPSPVSRAAAWMRGARGLRPGIVVAVVAALTLFIVGSLAYAFVSRAHKAPADVVATSTTTTGDDEPAAGGIGDHGATFIYPSPAPEPSPSPHFMLSPPGFPFPSPTPFVRASFEPYRNSPGFSPAPVPSQAPQQQQPRPQVPVPNPVPTRGPSSSVVAFADPEAAAPPATSSASTTEQTRAGSDGQPDVPPITSDGGSTSSSASGGYGAGGGSRASTSFASDRQSVNPTPAATATPSNEATGTNSVGYVRRISAFQIAPTTVLTCRLRSKIVSDLPGPFICEITKPVYDTATHDTEVIPAGTMVYSTYSTGLINGQNRLAAAGAELVFQDGREFLIGNQAYTDAQGAAGLTGDVDPHRGPVYGAAFLLTAIGAASAAIAPTTGGSIVQAPSVGDQARTTAGEQVTQLGTQLITRNLQRAPTIIIRPPDEIQMIVSRDLPLDAFEVKR